MSYLIDSVDLEIIALHVDIVKVDLLLVQKISKRHFLRDIEKSFQEVTLMSPEPHHFFLFEIFQQIK